ncbi:MAG: type II secretion system inner membrane protein GspF [Gammaproteobacteria bacterium]|nr:type II secretion system inner membrane protein GspF [Gammaproteobacteria bacterium]
MAAYEYQALNAQGRTVKGVLEGDNERQVRGVLRDKGLTPLAVNAIRETSPRSGAFQFSFSQPGISGNDLALITRQFSTLVHAGLTIEDCLNALIEQTESRRVSNVLAGVRGHVLEGQSLARAMAQFPNAFPDIYRSMIEAGEQSGQLAQILERLADYMENRQALQNKVVQAFIYPALVTMLAIAMVSLLMVYVVPKVTRVFENTGQELPALTKALLWTSDTVRAGGMLWPVAIIAIVFAVRYALRQPHIRHAWHHLLLRMPVTGRVTRGVNAARMANALGILVASGIPLLSAMRYGVDLINNIPMRTAMEHALHQVREGGSFSRALGKSRLFPPLIVHLIGSGEATGKLDTMLVRAAEAQERELENWVKTFTAILEPLLIIGMGVMVLLIVLAIMMPIFEMNQLVK